MISHYPSLFVDKFLDMNKSGGILKLKNIHWMLIPQTLLILLILHLMGMIDKTEEIIYIVLFIIIYLVSFLYFHLIMFVFKSRPKMNAKTRKALIKRLYKIYSLVGVSAISFVLFYYIEQWNQSTLTYLATALLLLIPLIYFSVRLSLWIVEKNRVK